MRIVRPVIFAVLIAGAFFYFSTYRNHSVQPSSWVSHPATVEITEAASGADPVDSEEQNNISVYRKNIGSVVNITACDDL
jgi:hypothetical protein